MAPAYHDQRPRTSDGPQSRRPNTHDQYGPGRRSREHSPSFSSRLRPDDRYSSRYNSSVSQPHTRSSSPAVPFSRPKQSPRSTWPPQPKVEDEKVSLAKESRPPIADSDRNEGPSRGAIDQNPIMVETEYFRREFAKANTSSKQQRQPSSKNSKETLKERAGHDNIHIPSIPEFTGRSPSPYVFTPKAPETARFGSDDSGYFSSAERKYSSLSDNERSKSKNIYALDDRAMSDALRGKGKSRHSFSRTTGLDDSDHDDSSSAGSSQAKRNPARYSYNRSELQDKELRTSLREAGLKETPPRVARLKVETGPEARRNTDSASSMQRPRLSDGIRPPRLQDLPAQSISTTNSPLVTPTSTPNGGDYFGSPSVTRNSGVWDDSPSNPTHRANSPPRSREGSISKDSPRYSRHSRPNSLYGSRPPSPASSDTSRSEQQFGGARRASTFPNVLDYDPKPRLGSSNLTQEPETLSPSPQPRPAKSSALPYPVDDMNLMPSEVDHQYKPRALDDPFVPRASGTTSVSTAQAARPGDFLENSPVRPRVSSRHTMNDSLPLLNTGVNPTTTRPEASSTSAKPSGPPVKALAPCPRIRSSRNYNDWYTLQKAAYFDICPSCVESNFKDTAFRGSFYLNTSKDPQAKTKCDFGSPWMRLAWLLTQKQRRNDLDLIYSLARITRDESPCSGDHNEARSWYSPIDKRGDPVDGYEICYADMKRIEALVPSARGLFVRNSYSSGHRRKCDMRTESKRFTEYLDLLIEIDETARSNRRAPDLERFVQYAQLKAQMQECARATVLKDCNWHFMPQLPEFTVCEECYTAVVWPAIANGSPLASRFNQTPQPVFWESRKGDRRSGGATSVGTSCQLYSPRMRKVFRKAVRDDDFRYLASIAQQRKEVELELQARFNSTKRLSADAAKLGGRNGLHPNASKGLDIEFDRIAAEWEKYE